MELLIRDLNAKEEMLATFPLINQMYRDMDFAKFNLGIDEMILRNNYKMIVGIIDAKIVAVCGYWVSYMFYCEKYLQASNLVVDENIRSQGIGKKLLNYLENKARDLSCNKMVLDSYTENKKSHSLYFGEDFYIRGFHFMKDL